MMQQQGTRREILKTIGAGIAVLTVGTKLPASGERRRPNVLFIFTDDQRWDTIGALGNPEIRTPNLDRLVAEGFHFNNAYCMGSMVGAVCLPSRTMLATGRSLWHIPANPRQDGAPWRATAAGAAERRRLRDFPLRQGRQRMHVQ
jgi:hypothetical protein